MPSQAVVFDILACIFSDVLWRISRNTVKTCPCSPVGPLGNLGSISGLFLSAWLASSPGIVLKCIDR